MVVTMSLMFVRTIPSDENNNSHDNERFPQSMGLHTRSARTRIMVGLAKKTVVPRGANSKA